MPEADSDANWQENISFNSLIKTNCYGILPWRGGVRGEMLALIHHWVMHLQVLLRYSINIVECDEGNFNGNVLVACWNLFEGSGVESQNAIFPS